jgi:hypothetical protein
MIQDRRTLFITILFLVFIVHSKGFSQEKDTTLYLHGIYDNIFQDYLLLHFETLDFKAVLILSKKNSAAGILDTNTWKVIEINKGYHFPVKVFENLSALKLSDKIPRIRSIYPDNIYIGRIDRGDSIQILSHSNAEDVKFYVGFYESPCIISTYIHLQ